MPALSAATVPHEAIATIRARTVGSAWLSCEPPAPEPCRNPHGVSSGRDTEPTRAIARRSLLAFASAQFSLSLDGSDTESGPSRKVRGAPRGPNGSRWTARRSQSRPPRPALCAARYLPSPLGDADRTPFSRGRRLAVELRPRLANAFVSDVLRTPTPHPGSPSGRRASRGYEPSPSRGPRRGDPESECRHARVGGDVARTRSSRGLVDHDDPSRPNERYEPRDRLALAGLPRGLQRRRASSRPRRHRRERRSEPDRRPS